MNAQATSHRHFHDELFTKPKVEQTEAYITGRFG